MFDNVKEKLQNIFRKNRDSFDTRVVVKHKWSWGTRVLMLVSTSLMTLLSVLVIGTVLMGWISVGSKNLYNKGITVISKGTEQFDKVVEYFSPNIVQKEKLPTVIVQGTNNTPEIKEYDEPESPEGYDDATRGGMDTLVKEHSK
jgi:hypothetical protein